MKKMRCGLLVFVFMSSLSFASDSKQEPFHVTVFGDSGTKAMIADSTVGFPGPRFHFSFLRALLTGIFVDQPGMEDPVEYYNFVDRTYGFLGREYLSAFLGDQPYSLPRRISEKIEGPVEVLDLSKLGASYFGTESLTEAADAVYRERGKNADLLLVNFFGIDFILNQPLEQFEADIVRFFSWAAKTHPEQIILVTGFPNLVELITREDQLTVPGSKGRASLMCSELIEKTHFAEKVGLYPGQKGVEVQDAQRKLFAMNKMLLIELAQMERGRSPYETFSGKVLFVESIRPSFRWQDYIAADCIHPNQLAQRLLADKVWRSLSPEL